MWWVASSLFNALDIWTTIAMLEDECHTEGFSCLLGTAGGNFNTDGSYQGAGMPVIEDEFARAAGASGIDVHNTVWTYDLFGKFHTGGNLVDSLKVQVKVGSEIISEVDFGAQQTTDYIDFNISAEGTGGDTAIAFATFQINGYHQSTAQFGSIFFNRATGTGIPYAP